MYPNPPFEGFTWPLSQHMGPLQNRETLFQTLLAAATFSDTVDPAVEITNYLVINNIFTPNIRSDSGQADTWRDYQQVLSELGLIHSTQVEKRITPTPLGLAFLDETLSFSEVMTLQVLRYQYPNGHKVVIDRNLRTTLAGGRFSSVAKLAHLQQMAGVEIRPAVLVWRVIRRLAEEGETPRLSVEEIQTYLMRCSTHTDTQSCVNALIASRREGLILNPLPRGKRNAQDWVKLLQLTSIFSGTTGRDAYVGISLHGKEHATEIDSICALLEESASFWRPGLLDVADRNEWYSQFGSLNVDIGLVPQNAEANLSGQQEEEGEREIGGSALRQIALRDFSASALGANEVDRNDVDRTITSSYNAGLANNKSRLHDLMVIYIAKICLAKRAQVYDDPSTVDLLVKYKGSEFIVEVKSVTSRNFIIRLRYALGQVCEYDYKRSLQSDAPRRKVVAIAAQIGSSSWFIPYFNDFMNTDLLSLQGQTLKVDSYAPLTRELFGTHSPTFDIGI